MQAKNGVLIMRANQFRNSLYQDLLRVCLLLSLLLVNLVVRDFNPAGGDPCQLGESLYSTTLRNESQESGAETNGMWTCKE